jgi:hypothetical protein
MPRKTLYWLLPFVLILTFLMAGCSNSGETQARPGLIDDDDAPLPDDDAGGNDDDQTDDDQTDDDDTVPSNNIIIHSPTEGQIIVGPVVFVQVEYIGTPDNPDVTIDTVSVLDQLVYTGNMFYGNVTNVAEGPHKLTGSAFYSGNAEQKSVNFGTTNEGNHGWIEVSLSASYISEGGQVTASYIVYNALGQDVTGQRSDQRRHH